jgi:hypothetical protein
MSREESSRKDRNRILQLEIRCPNAGCEGGSNSGDSGSGDSSSNTEDGHQDKKRRQDDGAESSSVPAVSCEWTGQLKDSEAHVAACPYAHISCPFADAGCGFRAARRDMDAHSGDAAAHFLMLKTSFAAVRAEGTAMKSRITALEAECASGRAYSTATTKSLQLYVSILQRGAGGEGMEWISLRNEVDEVGTEGDDFSIKTYTGQVKTPIGQRREDGRSFHGLGRASWVGKSYDGQWKDSTMHGQGVLTYTNGKIFEGRWEEGKRQGEFVFTRAGGDGTRYSRVYKDNQMLSEKVIVHVEDPFHDE